MYYTQLSRVMHSNVNKTWIVFIYDNVRKVRSIVHKKRNPEGNNTEKLDNKLALTLE